MRRRTLIVVALLVALLAGTVPLRAQTAAPPAADIERLSRLGPIAYVTAHPDDESAAVITYLARGLHARVVILCLTRGEGGQNQAGPELGGELAEVRTRELEQAAAGYGAEVRFLGAEDFGYSKSVEETLARWDENRILGELVRQIRELRPLVVISAWTGTARDGGGSHHQAAGLLARRAFSLAGDAQAFPEQIAHGYLPWQPRFFLTRNWSGEGESPKIEVPVKEIDPATRRSYEELGWEAFRNHRSQGMDTIDWRQVARLRRHFLNVEATQPDGVRPPARAGDLVPSLAALPRFFPGVALLAERSERLDDVALLTRRASRLREEGKQGDAALSLVQSASLLAAILREIPDDAADVEAASARALLEARQNQYLEAAAALAGVELVALTDRAALTPGEKVWIGLAVRAGALDVFRRVGFEFGMLQLELPPEWGVEPVAAETTLSEKRAEFLVTLPEKLDPLQVGATPLRAQAVLTTGSLRLELRAPVRGLAAARGERLGLVERLDPRRLFRQESEETAAGARLEPVTVAPPVTLELEPRLRLLPATPGETTHEWCLRVQAHRPNLGKLSVWLDVPTGWYTPLPQEIELGAVSATRRCFALTLPERLAPGSYQLAGVAGSGSETYRLARRAQPGGTSAAGYTFEPAQARVEILDVKIPPALRIGYIGFNDDPLPALLGQLGIGVDMLDEQVLARVRLADYDAIVIATRAYDYRSDLPKQTPRLLDYVKAGGTLVVEHQGDDWNPASFTPYLAAKPAHRRSPRLLLPEHPLVKFPNPIIADDRNFRVTDESTPVRVLNPEHPLLRFPNPIGENDWKGWVQERGLYFMETWSEDYTPLVELADAREEPQRGALLYARYGKGAYVYCGLALFRQVREGVPGGIRLYVNLLSHRRRASVTGDQRPPPSDQ